MGELYDYHDAVVALFDKLKKETGPKLQVFSDELCKRIQGGAVVYVFGAGHSSMLAEEAFHRAGGLVPVYPVLLSVLSPHMPPSIAGKMERLSGVAPIVFNRLGARADDVMVIASNSGVNAAAIEMAEQARAAGLHVVAITSMVHSAAAPSRHSSGKKLYELAHTVFDNCCPAGDALVPVGDYTVGPGSTAANVWIWNGLVTIVAQKLKNSGQKLPIYKSANMPGGDQHNEALEAQYRARIPYL
jgi:uncharacterized phosphosugar-binding protein